MSNSQHRYQKILDEIKMAGIRVTGSENRHKILYKLCLAHGRRINGSAAKVGQYSGLPRKKITEQTTASLNDYLVTGLLFVPTHFYMRGDAVKYRHDSDRHANRNLYRESNKAQFDRLKPSKRKKIKLSERTIDNKTVSHPNITLFDDMTPMSKSLS